ncbi:MAG: thermonuclease family protein [Chloroflexi bacterium]|nr:thermonuclease family protein [Chloroflexota bacterium]
MILSARQKASLLGFVLIGAALLAALYFYFASMYQADKDTDLFLVSLVIDGDTILLESGESVRYLGIDTPETNHPRRGSECYGPEATERNRELIEGKLVRLEFDTTDRDAYERLLRYVYVGNTFVNAVLVEEGFAYSYYYPPDTKHYDELLELELAAEAAGRGLWSACQS